MSLIQNPILTIANGQFWDEVKTLLSDHIPDDSQVITQINTSSVVHCVLQYCVYETHEMCSWKSLC